MLHKNAALIPGVVLLFLGSAPFTALFAVEDSFREEKKEKNKTLRELNKEGIDLAREGKYPEALEKFQYLEHTDKISAVLYNNIGYTHQLKKDYTNAIKSYQKSVQMDPQLVIPRQNLGQLLFNRENYKEAIEHGEKVLSFEPDNQSVKEWLPTAYQRYRSQLKAEASIDDKNRLGNSPYDILKNIGWQNLRLDFYARNILTIAGGSLNYYNRPIGFRIPMKFNLDVRALLRFKLEYESIAFAGILNPAFIAAEQNIELGYPFQNLYFGVGVKLTQANLEREAGFLGIRDEKTTDDFKLGFHFSRESNRYDAYVSIFSRYLFRDGEENPRGVRLDRNFLLVSNLIKPGWGSGFFKPRFLVDFLINEWYFVEYETPPPFNRAILGHYFGYYDLTLGVFIGDQSNKKVYSSIELGLKVVNRFYFRDLSDPNPFAFGNGQGFFGLTTSDSALRGDDFLGGFRTYATRFILLARFSVAYYFIFEGSLAYELIPPSIADINVFEVGLKVSFRI